MKGSLLVVIDLQSEHLDTAVEDALEPHRLNEDNLESIRNHHWDYWHYLETEIADPEVARIVRKQNARAYQHASFIRNLPDAYIASALIDPKGHWHDLQDCGWRMVDEPSPSNEAASKEWARRFSQFKEQFKELIGVEVVVHC